jgi:hypothetical protein
VDRTKILNKIRLTILSTTCKCIMYECVCVNE